MEPVVQVTELWQLQETQFITITWVFCYSHTIESPKVTLLPQFPLVNSPCFTAWLPFSCPCYWGSDLTLENAWLCQNNLLAISKFKENYRKSKTKKPFINTVCTEDTYIWGFLFIHWKYKTLRVSSHFLPWDQPVVQPVNTQDAAPAVL